MKNLNSKNYFLTRKALRDRRPPQGCFVFTVMFDVEVFTGPKICARALKEPEMTLTWPEDTNQFNTDITADCYKQVHLQAVKTQLCVSPNVMSLVFSPVSARDTHNPSVWPRKLVKYTQLFSYSSLAD